MYIAQIKALPYALSSATHSDKAQNRYTVDKRPQNFAFKNLSKSDRLISLFLSSDDFVILRLIIFPEIALRSITTSSSLLSTRFLDLRSLPFFRLDSFFRFFSLRRRRRSFSFSRSFRSFRFLRRLLARSLSLSSARVDSLEESDSESSDSSSDKSRVRCLRRDDSRSRRFRFFTLRIFSEGFRDPEREREREREGDRELAFRGGDDEDERQRSGEEDRFRFLSDDDRSPFTRPWLEDRERERETRRRASDEPSVVRQALRRENIQTKDHRAESK